MYLTKQQKAWNKEVQREVKHLKTAKSWLKDLEKHYALSWEDQIRVSRAQSFIDLAITEIYSTMFRTNQEVRLYKQHEISP